MNINDTKNKLQEAQFSLINEWNPKELKDQFTVNFFNVIQQIDFRYPLQEETVAQISSRAWEYFLSQPCKLPYIQGKDNLEIKNIDFIAFVNNSCIFQTCSGIGYGTSKKIYDGAVIYYHKDFLDRITIKVQVVAIKRIEKFVYQAIKEDKMATSLVEFNSFHIMRPALFTLNIGATKIFLKRTLGLVCEKLTFDLEQVINNKISFLEVIDKIRLLKGALKGLIIFHNANIIHRDIKPGNIMAKREDGDKKKYKAVLIDYEDSTLVQDVYDGENGTQMYKPPEAIGGSATLQWDLWAFGVTLWEMLNPMHEEFPIYKDCGREDIDEKLSELSKFDRIKMQEQIFNEWQASTQEEAKLQEIILNLLSINPQDRGSAQGTYAELNAVYKKLKQAILKSA